MGETEKNENLSFENELLRLKIAAETGAEFVQFSKLPAEIENQWLKHVYDFEKSINNRELIKIYDLIQRPHIPDVITESEIPYQLEQYLDLLRQHNIGVESLYEVEDHELYRFVIEDLFEYEIGSVRLPEEHTIFTYEDFYPNGIEDAKKLSRQFIDNIFEFDISFCEGFARYEFLFDENDYTEGDIQSLLKSFMDTYKGFQIDEIIFEEPVLNEDKVYQHFKITYSGNNDRRFLKEIMSGNGCFHFLLRYGYWYISGVEFPGLKL